MKYDVEVEKRLYCKGTVSVEAKTPEQAIAMIGEQIDSGELQTTAVQWNEPQYEDFSFDITGDVEEL